MRKGIRSTFIEIIQQHNIVVPPIQRDYVQGRSDQKSKDISDGLINALVEALKRDKECQLNFVIGTTNKDDAIFLLDGQQRLTTLFLLHFFIAVMSENSQAFRRLMWDQENTRSRFRYETRYTTQGFIDALLNCSPGKRPCHINQLIRQSNWYVPDYDDDASIRSMIDVLSRLEEKFGEFDYKSLYDRLFHRRLITFFFLVDTAIESPHEHYIKINSRGKNLSDFELFKSSFYATLDNHDQKQGSAASLLEKLDYEHQEILYPLFSGENQNKQVEKLLRSLIHTVFRLNELLKIDKNEAVRQSKIEVPLYSFGYQKEHIQESSQLFLNLMEALAELKKDQTFFDAYLKPTLVMESASSYPARTFLYCLAIYASKTDITNFLALKKMALFLRNLIINDDGIDSFEDVYSRCKQFAKLQQFGMDVVMENGLDAFSKNLLQQELEKARLIVTDNILQTIVDIEHSLRFFNGRITFLLRLAMKDGTLNMETLNSLAERAKYFSGDNYEEIITFFLAEGVDCLAEPISISAGTYTFGYNDTRHYAHHWRAVFNDRYDILKDALQSLLSQPNTNTFITSCKTTYLNQHNEETFHNCLIEEPSLLKNYMKVAFPNYGRYWKRGNADYYLLSNTQRVNYSHYLLLFLFVKMKNQGQFAKIEQNKEIHFRQPFIDTSHITVEISGTQHYIYYCGENESRAKGFYSDENRDQPYRDKTDNKIITSARDMLAFFTRT